MDKLLHRGQRPVAALSLGDLEAEARKDSLARLSGIQRNTRGRQRDGSILAKVTVCAVAGARAVAPSDVDVIDRRPWLLLPIDLRSAVIGAQPGGVIVKYCLGVAAAAIHK